MSEMPEWLIDDTAKIGDARLFITHTMFPRFIAELFEDSEDEGIPIDGVTLSLGEFTLANIDWIDAPSFDADSLIMSLRETILRHGMIRGGK